MSENHEVILENLSDFCPIERLELPGLGELRCSGLILVVGPNSSGKSQLLRDIYQRIAGEPRVTVVATDIKIAKPHYESFVSCLEREGVFQKIYGDDGVDRLRPLVTYGTGEAAGEMQLTQMRQMHSAFQQSEDQARKRKSDFLSYFGKFLVTQLFLERRLSSLNSTNTIDFENQAPQHDLHALYLNKVARELLLEEVRNSFSRAAWPDISRGNTICMRVSSGTEFPSAEMRLESKEMAKYRQIETEGDGFKSYVATCVSLLLSRRPVSLIDEPELCLHPPQAYNLGKFIGKVAANDEGVTFVSTHSSQILRGAIQTASEMQIVRLTRLEGAFVAHLVSSEDLAEALKKPTVRAESVLDGIFSQAVVVVEADTDRTVYQSAWESIASDFNRDVHFSSVGGIGGIADTVRLYRTLKIPVAVISDLDLLTNVDALQRIVTQLADQKMAEDICVSATSIAKMIKEIPPIFPPGDVQADLRGILDLRMDWGQNDDFEVKKQISSVVAKLDRMTIFKEFGTEKMPSQLASDVHSLLTELEVIGLFIVPKGEVESWISPQVVTVSRRKKWAWANSASVAIRASHPAAEDLRNFVRGVGVYLFK